MIDVRRCFVIALLFLSLPAIADEATIRFDIPAQSLAEALRQFASQAKMQLVYKPEAVSQVMSNAVVGEFSSRTALETLLKDKGFEVMFITENAATIRPAQGNSALTGAHDVIQLSQIGSGGSARPGAREPERRQEGAAALQSSGSEAHSSQLQEITVTAQKRGETSVNDTSTSITAISSEDIELKGYTGLEDYLPSMPSVSFVKTGIAFNNVIIRGITINTAGDSSVNPLVSFYLGDTPIADLAYGGAPDIKLTDVDRVELLRGPQGTLYGSGSMSGALRVIPAAPKLGVFEGSVGATYSVTHNTADSNHEIQAVLNLPVLENTLAVRVVGYQFENGGYFDSVSASDAQKLAAADVYGGPVIDGKIGATAYSGYRLTALWTPLESLRVTVGHLGQERSVEGIPEMGRSLGRFQQAKWGSNLGTGADIALTNLEVQYTADKLSVVSSTSWAESDAHLIWDAGRILGPAFGSSDIPVIQRFPSNTVEALTQEVRVFSHTDSRLQWLAGGYFRDADYHTALSTLPWVGDAAADPLAGSPWLNQEFSSSTRESALFGELYFDLTEKLMLTVGGRYFEFDQSSLRESSGRLGNNAGPTLRRSEGDGTIGKINLSYRHSDGKLVYAQFSQGFRLGRPHDVLPSVCDADSDGMADGTSITIPSKIDSDKTDNWEVGSKLALLGGRMQFNIAAFSIDWVDIPLSVRLPCALFVTLNAGTARSSGIEIEGSALLTDALRLNYAASYVNAELTSNIPFVGNDGDRIPGSPKYNAGIGLQYDFALLGRPAFARVDASYVGGYHAETTARPPEMGAYTTVNLRGGAQVAEGVSIDVFANNLTNEFALTGVYRTGSEANLTVITPRTVGLQMRYRF